MFFYRNPLKWVQDQKILHTDDNVDNDAIGFYTQRIDLSDNGTLIAASILDNQNGGSNAGAVFVFKEADGNYQQIQKLTASGDLNPAGDRFGYSVSISSDGTIVAISAYGDEENGTNAGSVYIFQSGSEGYQQVQKLTASTSLDPAGDRFGISVSLNSTGDILAVGSQYEDPDSSGAVYIYRRENNVFEEVQKLGPTEEGQLTPLTEFYGAKVILSDIGDKLLVSTGGEQIISGSWGTFYIYHSASNGFQEVQKFAPETLITGPGREVSANHDISKFVFSTVTSRASGTQESIFIIMQSGSSGYSEAQSIKLGIYEGLSERVFMDRTGDTFILGSTMEDNQSAIDAGAVYVYQSSSLGYQQVQRLTASGDSNPAGDRFGSAICIKDDDLYIAATWDDVSGSTKQGSIYRFKHTRDY